jgi:alkanesulfonate monooxygenase SsuD/methylene tetrahydromethanopterin reductase-like flavin-dependent oxidoreductase (luciferase family)
VSYPDVPVRPFPARPGGPPIWIGGLSEAAIRRAGRIADGFMATEVTPAELAEQVAIARAARADEGPFEISVHVPTFPWHGEDAWEIVRPHHWYVSWKYDDMDEARHRVDEGPPPPEIDDALDEALRAQIALGTPEQVIDRIRELVDAAGGNLHYIARLYFPGLAPDVQREVMRVFAEEVAPAFR